MTADFSSWQSSWQAAVILAGTRTDEERESGGQRAADDFVADLADHAFHPFRQGAGAMSFAETGVIFDSHSLSKWARDSRMRLDFREKWLADGGPVPQHAM